MSKAPRPPRSPSTDTRPLRLAKPRAVLIVYRLINDQPHFLLISAASDCDKLTLPGGKIDPHESPADAAIRETREEAGVLTDPPRPLGRYLHRKRKRRVHPTDTFLARYAGQLNNREDRARLWLHIDELACANFKLKKPIRKQLRHAAATLRQRRHAA